MKYCSKCGSEIMEEAIICPKCGCAVDNYNIEKRTEKVEENGLQIASKVLMVISCIFYAFSLIGIIALAWAIPMTVVYSNKVQRGESVGIGFKICTLLFVNPISGILMLCDSNK